MERILLPKHETHAIYFRTSAGEEGAKYVEQNAGMYYPLLRISDTYMIHSTEFVSFSLNIGSNFLPQLYATILDSSYNIREVIDNRQNSIITLYIGNTKNDINEPIKLDFIVNEIIADAGSENISYNATLYTKDLYDNKTAYSFSGTSYDFCLDIAKRLGLGFVSNVKSSNDAQVWIKAANETLLDSLLNYIDNFYISDTDYILVYVDAYMNLNYISLERQIKGGKIEKLDVNPFTNEKLETPVDISLSNRNIEKTTESDEFNYIPIAYWTTVSDFGTLSRRNANIISIRNFVDKIDTFTDVSIQDNRTQLKSEQKYAFLVDTDNVHTNYFISNIISKFNTSLFQNDKIICEIDTFVPQLYLLQNLKVNIYNAVKNKEIDNQTEAKTLNELSDESEKKVGYLTEKNEKYSSFYIIKEYIIRYAYSNNKNNVNMRLKLVKTQ